MALVKINPSANNVLAFRCDYPVMVVNLPGHGFHEVYRTVPGADQSPGLSPHNRWRQLPNSSEVELPTVTIVSVQDVRGRMVSLRGGRFVMGADGRGGKSWRTQLPYPGHAEEVRPFYLDVTEVTVGEYEKGMEYLPSALKAHYNPAPPDLDRYAVTFVTFHRAREFAERVGKRLPTAAEYEYAATAGGTRDYPWGNEEGRSLDVKWRAGPVGKPEFDCTPAKIYGLFSNAGEWTDGHLVPYVKEIHPSILRTQGGGEQFFATFRFTREVRGIPVSAVHRQPIARELEFGPRGRCSLQADRAYATVGFRCACSSSPRFMD